MYVILLQIYILYKIQFMESVCDDGRQKRKKQQMNKNNKIKMNNTI